MSVCLSQDYNVKARKRHRCALCQEPIEPGDIHHVRKGVNSGDFWTMRIHPECYDYEQQPGIVDEDWYEDIWEPSFSRADAIAFQVSKLNQQPK